MKILLEHVDSIKNSKYNFQFNKKITLKERYFFNYLMKEAIKRKRIIVPLEESFFTDFLKGEDIERFLTLLFEKKIIITNEEKKFSGFINLIPSFFKKDDTYIFFVSERVYDYLTTKENSVIKYQLDILLKIDNENIKNFYFYLLSEFANENEIIIEKKDLKNIIGIQNGYERFFDLETKFILPTLKLLKETSNLDILYTKIKGKDVKNSKIMKVKFVIPVETNLSEEGKKILDLVKPYIKNEETSISISQFLIRKNVEYVRKNAVYAIEHHFNNFDEFLLNSLKFDYAENRFNLLLDFYKKKYKIIDRTIETFSSMKKFEKRLKDMLMKNSETNVKETLLLYTTFKEAVVESYEEMMKNNQKYLYDHNKLLKEFQKLSKSKEFKYEDDSYIYIAEYNSQQDSKIVILKKELII
ncbi:MULTISPECIES: replication initiation protein [Fusobacterium]|uniref:replication initiation protein n=1 Tax=Fusobacterium TaxID=848 RepID=UPI0008A56BE8|nr:MULTISPECIES: replication initiation protein [Fusobacterium]OFL92712.1 hypothetical protein HMPREF2747_06845 [Fusobacterium sp. HMSC073F01]